VSGNRNPSRSETPVSPGSSAVSPKALWNPSRTPDPAAPEKLERLLGGQAVRRHHGVLDDFTAPHPIDDVVDRHRLVENIFARLEAGPAAIEPVIDLGHAAVVDDARLGELVEDLRGGRALREEDRDRRRLFRAAGMLQLVVEVSRDGHREGRQKEHCPHQALDPHGPQAGSRDGWLR
jgi:hypothetical protein